MKEKFCPICSKIIRSDANVHDYCALCGMGIPVHLSSLTYKPKNSKILYFCCDRCFSIFKAEILRENDSKPF